MRTGYTKSCGVLMFRFGYDFFDSKTSTMKRPNGARFNKQIIGDNNGSSRQSISW